MQSLSSLYRHVTLAVLSNKSSLTNDRPRKTKHEDANIPISIILLLSLPIRLDFPDTIPFPLQPFATYTASLLCR